MKTLETYQPATALELRNWLNSLSDDAPLDTVYINDHADFTFAIIEERLTDGSLVYNLEIRKTRTGR